MHKNHAKGCKVSSKIAMGQNYKSGKPVIMTTSVVNVLLDVEYASNFDD
jgi:hypothetical protein